jgi:hypothetical protein
MGDRLEVACRVGMISRHPTTRPMTGIRGRQCSYRDRHLECNHHQLALSQRPEWELDSGLEEHPWTRAQ